MDMAISSALSSFPECFPPKTKEEEEADERTYQMYRDHIETLPKLQASYTFCNYRGVWMPQIMVISYMAAEHQFKARPTDIFLATYPKAGTTWLKALAFSIANRHNSNGADPLTLLSAKNPHECVPFLEDFYWDGRRVPELDALPSPRLFATHAPHSLLPPSVVQSGCRIVYLCRDPKDIFVSTWQFDLRGREGWPPGSSVSMGEALEMYCSGKFMWTSVWEHMLGYWREHQRQPEGMLFLKYEDMKMDVGGVAAAVRRMAGFMGCPFTPEEEEAGAVEEMVEMCSFQRLSSLEVNKSGTTQFNPQVQVKNRDFFRRGEVGNWENHLTVEMARRLDLITEEKLHGSGLTL